MKDMTEHIGEQTKLASLLSGTAAFKGIESWCDRG